MSSSPETPPRRSFFGNGLTVFTVRGLSSFLAASSNAASSSTRPKKLFAGTTISVSLA
ncbi:hypothetical protein [Streptomyces sp. NBC_00272]|uniref:hypothetical protein n=1 Tax=Streptomyces sp. NBC_00272 TaxID=2975698 RepID=UPI002E297007|nr:hypothetical protein [Streptomyces sp. NBC_00272]